MIKSQEEIEVQFDNEFTKIKIVLNQKERYIKTFKRLNNLDITVVQILSKDGIGDDNFLLAEETIKKNNQMKYYQEILNNSPDKNARKKELIIKNWGR